MHNISISLNDLLWTKITSHYYENIRWMDRPTKSDVYLGLYDWLKNEYGAVPKFEPPKSSSINFDTEEQRTYFIMRWL
jgi:hypothetical protein